MMYFAFLGLLHAVAFWSAAEGSCDISKCSVVIYKDCQAAPACGSRSGVSCAYIAGGISGTNCAWNPCPAVTGNGAWQSVCGGIDAIDIIGPCKAQLAQDSNGGRPYSKIFQPGFHGVWATYENGVHFGDRVNSVKLSCADTDECASSATNNCSSNAVCTNTVGSYTCSCKSGFSGDGYMCSDIDECQQGTHGCSMNADCTNTVGGSMCSCKQGYFGNGSSCDGGNHNIVCDENFMMINLDSRLQLENGSMTLRNSSCVAKRYAPSNALGLLTTYTECGTTSKENSTHIVYENEAIWTFGTGSGGITRISGKKIQFSCSFERHRDTSNVNIAPTVTYMTATEAGYGQFSVSLSMHQSNAFNSVVNSFPAAVTLGARVYFEAAIGSNDSNIVALIEKCSASPTTNKNHASSYSLITNRCAADNTVQFHNSRTHHKVQFSFDSFVFVNYGNNVYIHCQIFMCHKSSSDSRCSSGCQGNNLSRLRRSLPNSNALALEEIPMMIDDLNSLVAKRVQRRDVSDKVYPPSRTYDLNIGPLDLKKKEIDPQQNTQTGQGKSFTATHGLILAVSVLGVAIVAIAIKAALKWRTQGNSSNPSKNPANEKGEGAVNGGYELS